MSSNRRASPPRRRGRRDRRRVAGADGEVDREGSRRGRLPPPPGRPAGARPVSAGLGGALPAGRDEHRRGADRDPDRARRDGRPAGFSRGRSRRAVPDRDERAPLGLVLARRPHRGGSRPRSGSTTMGTRPGSRSVSRSTRSRSPTRPGSMSWSRLEAPNSARSRTSASASARWATSTWRCRRRSMGVGNSRTAT